MIVDFSSKKEQANIRLNLKNHLSEIGYSGLDIKSARNIVSLLNDLDSVSGASVRSTISTYIKKNLTTAQLDLIESIIHNLKIITSRSYGLNNELIDLSNYVGLNILQDDCVGEYPGIVEISLNEETIGTNAELVSKAVFDKSYVETLATIMRLFVGE